MLLLNSPRHRHNLLGDSPPTLRRSVQSWHPPEQGLLGHHPKLLRWASASDRNATSNTRHKENVFPLKVLHNFIICHISMYFQFSIYTSFQVFISSVLVSSLRASQGHDSPDHRGKACRQKRSPQHVTSPCLVPRVSTDILMPWIS